MDKGWVKLHRKLLDNPVVCKDSDHIAVWVIMLLSATHTPQQALFGGNPITLQAGQFISGRKAISNASKVEESKVNRIIKFFKKQQLIEQQTSTKNSLFTILNWNEYQDSEQQNEQQVNSNCTTSEHKQECKNERTKEIIEREDKPKRFIPPTLEEVKAYCSCNGYNVDCERFVAFYESNGWKVGKNKMKDWKASVRGWHSRNKADGRYITESEPKEDLLSNSKYEVPVFDRVEQAKRNRPAIED